MQSDSPDTATTNPVHDIFNRLLISEKSQINDKVLSSKMQIE